MPFSAPSPVPTMIAVGVARPMAHGQAMTSTATILISARVKASTLDPIAGAGTITSQVKKVIAAIRITAGTKMPDTWSASFWIGALLPCASSTSLMICARASLFADASRFELDEAALIERSSDDRVSLALFHRHQFAGQHGFVDRRTSFNNHAIHGELFAGPHQHQIANSHLIDRDVDLFAISHDAGRFGLQIQQFLDGFTGSTLGTRFQILAQANEGDDDRGCLEIHGPVQPTQNDWDRVEIRHRRTQPRSAHPCWQNDYGAI